MSLLIHGILVVVAIVALAPIAYMFLISTGEADPEAGLVSGGLAQTTGRTIDNYTGVLTDETVDFPLYLRNTLLVAVLSVTGTTLVSAICAYGFARIRWRGNKIMFIVMLATMMIPFPVVMVPLFVMYRSAGLVGTFAPLWLPAWFGSAFSIFLLRQFFLTLPRELDEAARIDGCGHFGNFLHVILPLSRSALLVVALLHFMYVWNDFLAPLIFLNHRDQFTLALGLQLYVSKIGQTPWNLLMSATVIMTAPVLLLFLITQRSFIEGISTAGTKG
ncbi:MAG: sugar ABC transporter ATP-binding protein [Phycisphaerae bacterium]|nr:sugar ABC transporter ATP-binding protein [Phycisphaerae bacterium]